MKAMNDDLLIKYLLRETTSEEDVSVKEWIETSEANKQYLSQFQKIWDTSKKLTPQSTIDENEAWLRFKEKASTSTATTAMLRSNYFSWLRIAAMLLIAVAAWSVYSYLLKTDYTTLAAKEEVRTDILPDGSEVTMNKNSVLSYKDGFEGDKRLVKLQSGEAFFKVTHDQSKPFEIEVENVIVTVVGTSFNVKHLKDQTEVIVESGIVRVTKGDEVVELGKGEKVNIGSTQDKLVKEVNRDQLYNYYRTREFVSNGTPLWRVVEVLNEAYGANIVIENPTLRDLSLTTTFKEQSLENILDVISKTFDIKIEKTANQIILK